ncbi:MAG: Crp/Fnr family transcriptional regulator [Terricaulis sp.]
MTDESWAVCRDCKVGRHAVYGEVDPDEVCRRRDLVLSVKAGQHVVRAGEQTTHIHTIHSGWAFRYSLLADGRRQILEFLLPGDMITIESLLGCANPDRFHVRALTDLVLCAFTPAAMEAIAPLGDTQHHGLRRGLCQHMAMQDRRLVNIGRRKASGRLAQLILELSDKLSERGLADARAFECPIRREHLADALGLTSAHVNRTIAEFGRKGLLAIDDRIVRILNRDALRKIAED